MALERIDRSVPTSIERGLAALAARVSGYASAPVLEAEADGPTVPVSHYLWILKRHRGKIACFVAATLLATLVVTARITPIYESTATIDIDRQTPQGVIGQEATRSTVNDADQFLSTQVRLVQSDSVLRPVAAKHRLLAHERGANAQISADAPVQLRNLKISRPPNTYLLLINYRSPDARLAADVANGIAQSYLEHTYRIRYRSSSSLSQFMERQIEELKVKMEKSSAARQTIAKRVETEYQEAISREKILFQAVAETKAEFNRINARSFEYKALKREAEADKKLYEELVRKIKEAGINASFQNSAIRIADAAWPGEKPVSPNLKLNLLIALVVSLFLAVAAAIASDALDTTVRDPEQVARTLGTEVIGTLPVMKNWRGRIAAASGPLAGGLVKADAELAAGYEESIRTLRNSILLTDFNRELRSLLVTSASPGEGKSTIAAHLAMSHAEQGHMTILIDGDLRKPSVQKRFNLTATTGLTTALLGEHEWREALIQPEGYPNLHILAAGPPSRRAGDLVCRALEALLEEAQREYQLVILDAPPLLGFAEPLQMATLTDGVIVVTRAGATNRQQVATVLATLNRLRANVVGLVLNQVVKDMSDSYTYCGYDGKYYAQRAG
jgi:capsular exopolysaccharide synthesis family protein